MSSHVVIRPVAPEDFDQWLPLWAGYNRFYGRDVFPNEITHRTWTRFFDAYEPVHCLVAEVAASGKNKQILGLVHYLFHRSTIQIQPVCYLQDLFTSEAARNTGVGGRLIEAVYERARIAGSPRIYWQTHETNLTAMRLYDKVAERSGFVVYRKQL
jgi:GNAT superfamily N-acetyltransferase